MNILLAFAFEMNSLPNLLSKYRFWITEIGGCDMAQMNANISTFGGYCLSPEGYEINCIYSCFRNLCLGAFFFPARWLFSCQGTLKMDGYLFWTPVAPAISTTNCLEKEDTMVKCTT